MTVSETQTYFFPAQGKEGIPQTLEHLTDIAKSLSERPFDRDTIPQESLDLANKFRTSLFPWRGQFSPELIEIFLNQYGNSASVVLDPFLGSGTTLFEAVRKGITCYGAEINPSAVIMSKTVEFANISLEKRKVLIKETTLLADKYFKSSYDLFSYQEDLPITQISLEDSINIIMEETKSRPYIYNIINNIIIRFMNYKEPHTKLDFINALREHIKIIESLPYSTRECKVFHSDARKIPLQNHSIDLVITSPPYINVFNYHQNNRNAMELVGWNLLDIAKSEIGSNRKHRQNRFLTVVQYALDMLDTLQEIRRLMQPRGRAIIVVGRESSVRGAKFSNSLLVAMLAIGGAGFILDTLQERKFINKFGETIYEDILHLVPHPKPELAGDEFARLTAIWHLNKNITIADKQVSSEISEAIERANTVLQSPLFNAEELNAAKDETHHADETEQDDKVNMREVLMPKKGSKRKVILEEIQTAKQILPTPHFEKLKAVLESNKLPPVDKPQVDKTIKHYEQWIAEIEALMESDQPSDQLLAKMVKVLNEYRIRLDIDLIFDSQDDWLYRQKGQIKLDNSVIEEFLPRLVHVCLKSEISQLNVNVGPIKAFSAIYFNSSLINPKPGGGLSIRSKDQDFTISRPLYLQASNTPDFKQSVTEPTNLAYIAAECKTNLDKTMFQEACATAADLKSAIPGARYFLLCEWLDMPPISTTMTPIDKVFLLRKAKRLSSNIRANFDKVKGRQENKELYLNYLNDHPYRVETFQMFLEEIQALFKDENLDEEEILRQGFF